MSDRRDLLLVQIPGWLLLVYLVYAQVPAAFDYELGVRMGTQEPVLVYIPVLAAGLLGLWRDCRWSPAVLGAALGITIYWPVVALAAAVDARDAEGWAIDETLCWAIDETLYWIVLPIITLWALVALIHTARTRTTS
jgi:hypothetical protein